MHPTLWSLLIWDVNRKNEEKKTVDRFFRRVEIYLSADFFVIYQKDTQLFLLTNTKKKKKYLKFLFWIIAPY